MSSTADPSPQDFALLVHLLEHLRCQHGRSGHPAVMMVSDCWFFAPVELPAWAIEAAQANEPGWTWCPLTNPNLLATVTT